MRQYDLEILSKIIPFSFLPEKVMEELFKHFSIEKFQKDSVLFTQGESKVDKLYIILKGSLQRFYESDKGKKLSGELGEGDVYGGMSMLINKSVSLVTLKASEDSVMYTLPAEKFLEACSKFEHFKGFFTNTFGKWMQNKSYAGIMARQTKEKPFGTQKCGTK